MFLLIIIIILCLILITILAGAEYAYFLSNPLNIELKKQQGKSKSRIVASFFDNTERFWASTVIGFYITLVGTCMLIAIAIENFLPDWYLSVGGFSIGNNYINIIISVFIAAFLILTAIGFWGKRTFEYQPEAKLTTWSYFLSFLGDITVPFAKLFSNLSIFFLKFLFNVRISNMQSVYEKIDVQNFVKRTIKGHHGDDAQKKALFEKALRLSKLKVRKCLTPRNEAIAIDISAPIDILKEKFIETKLTKIVVYDKTLDNILGYAHHLDLNKKPNTISDILHPIPIIPETTNAIDLLSQFTKERKSIAWVVDEFGGTAGFTTLEDILGEVFGDIREEKDIQDYTERKISENEFIFSGRLALTYLNETYNLDIPIEKSETLSGHIITNHGSIPNQKERIIIDNLEFEILLVTATRIETVKLKMLL